MISVPTLLNWHCMLLVYGFAKTEEQFSGSKVKVVADLFV